MENNKCPTRPHDTDNSSVNKILDTLTSESFDNWYQGRIYRQNIRDGKPYFNGPSPVPPPHKHSPSGLLQCHRKIRYRQENAPEEVEDPEGILWTGRRIEEDIVVPFLQDAVATETTYVRNSVWIDFVVDTAVKELRIKGVTDPLIVDSESIPLVPTEVKTTSSVEYKQSPNPHHRAQLHAYIVGLSKKFNVEITEGAVIYVSRDTLEMKVFVVEFDEEFWEDVVVEWAAKHTEYRLKDELPPQQPEYDWECKFCSFKERCGKGNSSYANISPSGILPGVDTYPRDKVVEYLKGHDKASLTPILAEKYPDLTDHYPVQQWECGLCSATYNNSEIRRDHSQNNHPLCSKCATDGTIVELSVPVGDRQEK
ncbi:CRISPR-associated protein Cas4 [Haloarcula marina]|uniref:CRISPR-associated protein Cas4 n=1 Tax=Haloarcula marina TaxID=2961574 RepID=UPI0020B83BB5|nr:PD-(D/E)XK nuclease family protein [Halomicroarcula marina]